MGSGAAFFAVAVAMGFAGTTILQAAPITYALVPAVLDDSGVNYDLTGSITTDGTFGQLGDANVLYFSWTAKEEGGPNVYSTGGAPVRPDLATFTATASALSISYPTTVGRGNGFDLRDPGYGGGPGPYDPGPYPNILFTASNLSNGYQANVYIENDDDTFEADAIGPFYPSAPPPYVFATVVPEPSTMGIALCGIVPMLLRRRRSVPTAG